MELNGIPTQGNTLIQADTFDFLKKAKKEAQAAGRAKSQLLRNLSHEFKTPLNGVLGISQLLESTELDAEQQDYLETIKAMIQNGLGWGVLPESMIDDSLHKLKIKGVKMDRQLGLLLHQSRTLSSSANALLETLKNSN